MARKYARDNRGRFASGGSGATARGGRLKTASGNKRATQTMKAAGAGGVIRGRTARTVAGEKVMAKLAKRAPAAKRISAARPGGTVAKPKGLKPGAIERMSLSRASSEYKTLDAREGRAKANASRLRSQLSLAEMRRDQNPYPKGKAAAKKERNRRQSAVDSIQKRLGRQYGAQVLYGQRRQAVDAQLSAVGRARVAAASLPRTSKRGATYQRSLMGGADASYRR